jgi:hypothetical protein
MKKDKNVVITDSGHGQFLLYQTEDGVSRIEVKFQGDTVWLSLNQMAELFQRDKSAISKHIKNIFEEGELPPNSVVAKFATTAADGKSYQVEYYNLDVIISVGYRVTSLRGTQFRIWATKQIKEYIIKGFVLDDERLKKASDGNYFDELLKRIRDIRSSEKMFWKKVLEIYATSIDYDPRAESSQKFFATVQNKMHWAAHGHTAAEVIVERADATKTNMGLNAWSGERLQKSDVVVAKNYLNEKELDGLNRIVSFYLDFAELRAIEQRPMYMMDWLTKLDEFLRISDKEILTHTGKISHDFAVAKAESEYEKYKALQGVSVSPVEIHFEESLKEVKKLEKTRKKN